MISTLVIDAKNLKIGNGELLEFYKILIETSPLDVKSDEQYSMQNLFECIFTKYIV